MSSRSTSGARGFPFAWIATIDLRASRSGGGMYTSRSNRPGRSKAGSTMSGRFVAATTVTLWSSSRPSLSVRTWESTRPALRGDGVDLVEEHDARRGGLRLPEGLPHRALALPDPLAQELRPLDGDEVRLRLRGDGL